MRRLAAWLLVSFLGGHGVFAAEPNPGNLRASILDLIDTYGAHYPNGPTYVNRLDALTGNRTLSRDAFARRFEALQREALLDHPSLRGASILVVKRKPEDMTNFIQLGLPSNHECHSSLPRLGYDNEIAILTLSSDGHGMKTLFRPEDGGYAGDIDLHWDADRLLFTRSNETHWTLWEIGTDGSGLRPIGEVPPDVDWMDACYLPNGGIAFGSTASYQSVPCWHGQKWVSNLYVMDGEGDNVRQVGFDQDHDFHPSVLDTGQIIYTRWDYTGINHIYLRQLMAMNPDGTGQRALYGSNSWYPNSLYYPRAIPGEPGKLACILSGYHGVHRMGQLVVVDINEGRHGAEGIVCRISGRGDPVNPVIKDHLVDNDWPKFLHPYPIDGKRFLVSCWESKKSGWTICLADLYDNVITLAGEPGTALLEPVLLKKRPVPPVIPDKVDLSKDHAAVYLKDVYEGPGLEGVPRGTVKRLRLAAYHFGYRGLAGPHKIGYGGPWEAMRILGTVPLEEDGSALFEVPANTPIAVQALDGEGKAVQLMRSWFAAMPGETVSCVGCHEGNAEAAAFRPAIASRRTPNPIEPWHGPARGFDFAREVQPVLNRHCVSCHNGSDPSIPNLRPGEEVSGYAGRLISSLGVKRLHPKMAEDTRGYIRYTPAYDALLPYVRRVAIEDDVSMLVPGEYHVDTSELAHMLQRGHHGVALEAESWDRIVTWIDLNAPCHGTWGDVYPVPDGADRRRRELQALHGGPAEDFERVPDTPPPFGGLPAIPAGAATHSSIDSPCNEHPAVSSEWDWGGGPREFDIDTGGGTLRMAKIPAGAFVMGEPGRDARAATIERPFWMGTREITNRQFRAFDPSHGSGYYAKRHARADDKGLSLDEPNQPAVRVSWTRAMDYCAWLSERTGLAFTLPTEAQWEFACRAGAATPMHYGQPDAGFAPWGNMADSSFSRGYHRSGLQITGGVEHLSLEGAALAVADVCDGATVTAAVGGCRPNAWGLFDMHGNAAEWTLTPYLPAAGPPSASPVSRRTVKGGSFFDRPERCAAHEKTGYPEWQRVFNTGFRVVCADAPAGPIRENP